MENVQRGRASSPEEHVGTVSGQRELVFGQKDGSVMAMSLAWKRKETSSGVYTVLYCFVEAKSI